MKKTRASRRERFFSTLILLFFCCAVILVVAIVVDMKMSKPMDVPVQATAIDDSATVAPLTLSIPATPEPTQLADATAAPSTAPEIVAPDFEFLPIYTRAETEEKVIAVTLDDCSHLDNLRTTIAACRQMDVKLTLFPLGQAVMKDGMRDILRLCVEELGYEIENRTWSNAPLYQLTDDKLANEIWSADVAVDYALDANYDMHFFRMHGGSGTRDTRTHAYLKQLGYDAIVTWTKTAGDATADELCQSLAPGNIYLFSTSSEDLEKMAAFIPYAKDQGYRFATLNELLGYEANAIAPSEVAILSQTLPALENYTPVYTEQKLGDRTWQVYLIQQRLASLGYLGQNDVDGMFGYGTSSALSEFQVSCGLLGSGVASTETQVYLFSDSAPAKSAEGLFS